MSTLSSKGQALIRARAEAYQPTAADRERVLGALRARLGDAAVPPDTSAVSAAAAASHSIWRILSAVVVGVGVVGSAVFFAQRSPSSRAESSATTVAPMVAAVPAAEPAEAVPAEAVPPPSTEPVAAATPPAPKEKDRLAAEVALLTRATRDLRAGHAADALKTLDEYRRRFPKGLLSEQHRAGRVQTLCALGRFQEAKARLAELPQNSPLAARAKEFCDSALANR